MIIIISPCNKKKSVYPNCGRSHIANKHSTNIFKSETKTRFHPLETCQRYGGIQCPCPHLIRNCCHFDNVLRLRRCGEEQIQIHVHVKKLLILHSIDLEYTNLLTVNLKNVAEYSFRIHSYWATLFNCNKESKSTVR